MPSHSSQRRAQPKADIPDKLYFRIGEVARLCAVETYVLRFWESEFTQLRPNKSGTGQRLYRKRDVEMALRIKRLLHDEGYTIAGARQLLQSESRKRTQPELPLPVNPKNGDAAAAGLQKVRHELRELLGLLAKPARGAGSRARSTEPQPPAKTLFES